jgi:Ca-activated chloride channel family protein
MVPGADFAVLLDGSSSMLAMDDGLEDRWTAAKRLLRRFISRRPLDRFSIVLFSAHPMTLSPLTADHAALDGMLEALRLDGVDDGTAIGSALMTGVRRLSQSPARSRVVLLLTDGSQNRGRVAPLEAAREAAGQGIRVYTVLMGRAGVDSVYPIDGQLYRLRVEPDFETLREIARITGGEAFSADDPLGLELCLRAIDGLEKAALPIDTPTEGRPLARWLLAFSAALSLPLAIDLARKRGQRPPGWLRGQGQ